MGNLLPLDSYKKQQIEGEFSFVFLSSSLRMREAQFGCSIAQENNILKFFSITSVMLFKKINRSLTYNVKSDRQQMLQYLFHLRLTN